MLSAMHNHEPTFYYGMNWKHSPMLRNNEGNTVAMILANHGRL